jgi:DnaK suppressor protein
LIARGSEIYISVYRVLGLPQSGGGKQEMAKNDNIAKTLKARLSELTGRVANIDKELHKQLSADFEEQVTDLEDQQTLQALGESEIREIRQIQGALKRIAEGTYGVCAQYGGDIDPKRLNALPTATRCISCAV